MTLRDTTSAAPAGRQRLRWGTAAKVGTATVVLLAAVQVWQLVAGVVPSSDRREQVSRDAATAIIERWRTLLLAELSRDVTDAELSAAGIQPDGIGIRSVLGEYRGHRGEYRPGSTQLDLRLTRLQFHDGGEVTAELQSNYTALLVDGDPTAGSPSDLVTFLPAGSHDLPLRLVRQVHDFRKGV